MESSNPLVDSPSLTALDERRRGSIELEKGAAAITQAAVDDFPEGGLKAWLVVLGVSCGSCVTFGFVNGWGLFQAYYEDFKLPHESPSNIAWIGSIQYAFVFLPGLAFGRLFDMGYLKLPVAAASAVLVACTFLTAECKEYWQFLLCQGFGIGLASGAIFTTTSMTLAHWFQKRLGLALACVGVGSCIGGTIIPVILRNLLQHTSFQWSLRILGFIVLGFVLVLNFTVERRLPPKPRPGAFVNLGQFRHLAFSAYCASLFTGFLGLYTCLTYIAVSAIASGISADLSFYLVVIVNGASLVGRVGCGVLADRYGPLNVMLPAFVATAVLTYAWPFAHTPGALVAVAVIYGIAWGSIAIIAQPVVPMGAVAEVGMRIGLAFTVMSLGAIAGPPIAGAILGGTGSFPPMGYYAGSAIVVSAGFMALTRHLILGRLVGRA